MTSSLTSTLRPVTPQSALLPLLSQGISGKGEDLLQGGTSTEGRRAATASLPVGLQGRSLWNHVSHSLPFPQRGPALCSGLWLRLHILEQTPDWQLMLPATSAQHLFVPECAQFRDAQAWGTQMAHSDTLHIHMGFVSKPAGAVATGPAA